MHFLNTSLNRKSIAACACALAMLSLSVGCQSRQLSWLGAQNTAMPGLTERQISLSKTPMALAHNEQPQDANSVAPVERAPLAPSVAQAPVPPNSIQLASTNTLRTPAATQEPVQDGVYTPRSGVTASQVMPAQYKPIGKSSASENVPRIAMGPTGVPSAGDMYPPANANVPRTQLVSHPNQPAHNHAGGHCPTCNHGTGVYKPMYPRFSGNRGCGACGQSSCSGECCGPVMEQEMAVPRSTDPQEYIFDGGDHDPQVRLKADLTQVGLDPEDTVIQYETMDGKTSVESGCRVAIYAPRFASVRKKTSTRQKDLALRAQTTLRPDGPGTIREQLPTAKVSGPIKAANSDGVRVVEAFRDRSRPQPAELILPMVTMSDAFKPFEDLSLIRNGDLKGTDLAKLSRGTAAARSWTNVDELVVLIDGQEALEATGSKRLADVTVYEHKGARIRLCKVASEQMANPGDVISFTIRFDNVGEQPLSSLVITDSLAPRLEYVEESQQASIPANFSMTPNIAGSSVLRWELEKGLKPGEGGLVRFSCKVR